MAELPAESVTVSTRARRPCATRRLVLLVAVVALVAPAAACSGGDGATSEGGRVRLIAPNGLRGLLDRERSTSQTTTTAPTTTTTTLPVAPFPVAQTSATFVDHARGGPARGDAPAQASRTIRTMIWYPTSVPPSEANPHPPAAVGAYPLIVFAHGYAIDAASYTPLLRDLAVGGYVVAAPDFPGTSTAYPGAADRQDSLEQPADISFVITSVLDLAAQPGPLQGSIDPNAVGVSGQSDGGVTANAAGWNTCCRDPRVKAGVIYTGATFAFEGEWFSPGTPPIMFVHATADEVNPYSASQSMFDRAQSPKYLMTIDGGSHLEVYVDPPWEPHVAAASVAFFDLHLKGDQSAAVRLDTLATQPGYSLQKG